MFFHWIPKQPPYHRQVNSDLLREIQEELPELARVVVSAEARAAKWGSHVTVGHHPYYLCGSGRPAFALTMCLFVLFAVLTRGAHVETLLRASHHFQADVVLVVQNVHVEQKQNRVNKDLP